MHHASSILSFVKPQHFLSEYLTRGVKEDLRIIQYFQSFSLTDNKCLINKFNWTVHQFYCFFSYFATFGIYVVQLYRFNTLLQIMLCPLTLKGAAHFPGECLSALHYCYKYWH